MAVTFSTHGGVASTINSSALAVTLPAGIVADDICLWHTHVQKSTLTHTYPGDWTVVGPVLNQAVSTRTLGLSFAWKRMAGGETGEVTVANGTSTAVTMSAISLWRGVSTTGTPYETQVSTSDNNSSLFTTEGLAIADADRMCVYLISIADDQATMSSLSSQSGMDPLTVAYNTEVTLGGGSILGMQFAQALSSGTVQGGTERHGTAEVWSAFEVALIASTVTAPFNPNPQSFLLCGVM